MQAKGDNMKIIHRICLSPKLDRKVRKKFLKLGIRMEDSGYKKRILMNYFDISENDSLWPEVNQILSSAGLESVTTRTVFTKKEITSSEWVLVQPDFLFGYPMPDHDGSWRNISFNAGKECSICGIGRKQIAPIHLKREPKTLKNNFMGTFWTYDLFARPEVFDIMSEKGIQGVEPTEAIHHKLLTPLKTIKQLKILQEHCPCIIDDNLVRDKTLCDHIKYNVLTKGKMKFSSDAFRDDMPDLIRTHEWFGSGHSAFQLILASAKFVQVYMENKWKGLHLAPIELV